MAQDNSGIMGLQEDYFSKGMLPPEMGIEVADGVMQNLDPQLRPAVDGISSEISGELADISDEELDEVIQLVQQLYDDPDNYPANRAALIQSGELTEEDLPPEYDPEALATMLYMLRKEKQARSGGMSMQPPSSMPPMAGTAPEMMQPPQGFARGGIAEAARLVAGSGRFGDTMLAHINPREARLLRKHGGSGTINPKTGLPEFIFKFLRKVWQAVWKPVKKFLQSDIGKIVARVALNVVLPGYGEVIYAGLQTAAQGGEFGDIVKNMAIAGATSYLGGTLRLPGASAPLPSPIQGPLDALAKGLDITSKVGKEALAQGVVSAGMGLAQGQSLKEAATSGLMAAGTVQASNFLDTKYKEYKGAQAGAPAPGTAPIYDIDPQTGVKTLDRTSAYSANNTGVPAYASSSGTTFDVDANAPNVPSNAGVRSVSSTSGQAQANAGTSTNMQTGANAGTSTTAPYKPVKVTDALSTMGEGATDMFKGNVSSGFDKVTQGAGDLFFPSSPTTDQLSMRQQQLLNNNPRLSPADALQMAKDEAPGLMRTYGPGAAAGLGIMAMAGGFSPPGPGDNPGPPQLPGPTGSDLLKQNPSKYLVQGLPGVEYDAQGNIIGNKEQYPYYKLPDIQVASNYGGQRQFADGGIVRLAVGGNPQDMARLMEAGKQRAMEQQQAFSKYESNRPPPPPVSERPITTKPITPPPGSGPTPAPTSPRFRIPGSGFGAGPTTPPPQNPVTPPAPTSPGVRIPGSRFGAGIGIAGLAMGGYPRKTGQISGPGTETSDSIPAMLSDGEFVMTAKAVRGMGKGSRREGAKKMYALMHQLERNAARG